MITNIFIVFLSLKITDKSKTLLSKCLYLIIKIVIFRNIFLLYYNVLIFFSKDIFYMDIKKPIHDICTASKSVIDSIL